MTPPSLNSLSAGSSAPAVLSRGERIDRFLRMLGIAAMLGLLFTPFVVDYAAQDDAYFAPKWAWMAIWSAAALAVTLARALTGRAAVFPLTGVWWLLALWTAWQWLAVAWAPSSSLALERAAQLGWLALGAWCGVQFLGRRRSLLAIAWGWVFIGLVTALWVLKQDFVHAWNPGHEGVVPNLPDWRGYLLAGLGNTNHVGDLLALTLLPAAALWGEARSWRAKLILGAAIVLIPAALIVCYSVGSNFALVAGAALMAGLVFSRLRARWFTRRPLRWIFALVAWALVVGWLVSDSPINPHRPSILTQGFGSARWADGWPTRLIIWANTLEIVRHHPWLGAGTGNFTFVYPAMHSALIENSEELSAVLSRWRNWTNAAHNETLQTWAELGIGGLMIFIGLIIAAFHSLLKDLSDADHPGFLTRVTLAGMLATWVLEAQMNFALQEPSGALAFYGLLAAVIIERRTRPRSGEAMPALLYDAGPLRLKVEWESMSHPTALGLALRLPPVVGVGVAAALAAGLGWLWVPGRLAPLGAQREYRLGIDAERILHDDRLAEFHFRRALEIDPDCTNCRSHYSQWLVDRRRGKEALVQIAKVRERLNAQELWEREARADILIGDPAAARRAIDIFQHWPQSAEELTLKPAR